MKLLPFLILACITTVALGETAAPVRPNIVLLLIDDMGYGDIAAHGNPVLKTPNFDRLHAESVRFTDFLVSPTCSPTRAALLTGMHELKSNVSHTTQGRNRMSLDAVILPQLLKSAGYDTAMFGKWHLGFEEEYRPYHRGFDLAVNDRNDDQKQHFDPVFLRNGKPQQQKGYRTDLFFDEAMKYIEQKKDKPFFCYLPTFTPHGPLRVPDKYVTPYRGKSDYPEFHGMVANVDYNLGRLLAKLDALNIADNTLLIVMGDNGGTYGVDTWNAGMRGCKAKAYLGAVRTFSFWRWPKRTAVGERDQLTCHHDVLPTVAALTGAILKPDHRKQLDGYDLTPLLEESGSKWEGENRMIVHHATRWPNGEAESHKYTYCGVRWGKYHLVRQHPCDHPTCGQTKERRGSICRLDRRRMTETTLPGFYGDLQHYKLTESGKWSLFDLGDDPHEDRTIAEEKPEVVHRMAKHFDQWWAQFEFESSTTTIERP